MARKSAASLSVVAGSIDERPEPPAGLTEFQRDLWKRVVAGEAASFFKTAATQTILAEFCRHTETAAVLTAAIDAFDPNNLDDPRGARYFGELVRLRGTETKYAAHKATLLRITNQARYDTQVAATAARKAGSERKPWETDG